jgi:predicted SAM-dependent methyltransferase
LVGEGHKVASGHPFSDWSWGNPDECTRRLDGIRAESARCEKLEAVAVEPVFTRRRLFDLGVTGVEFAAFRTRHPSGLAADFVQVRSERTATDPGRVFVLDGESYFIELDITAPLPFEAGCLDWVYAEHLIEHVSLDDGISWLSEVHRVLAPGGLLRLTTPDLRGYVRSYLDGGFFAEHRERMRTVLAPAPPMPGRPAFMLNQIFHFFGHRWIYDVEELRYALSRAGFDPDAVRVCAFAKGRRPDIAALDLPVRNDETIYIEVAR